MGFTSWISLPQVWASCRYKSIFNTTQLLLNVTQWRFNQWLDNSRPNVQETRRKKTIYSSLRVIDRFSFIREQYLNVLLKAWRWFYAILLLAYVVSVCFNDGISFVQNLKKKNSFTRNYSGGVSYQNIPTVHSPSIWVAQAKSVYIHWNHAHSLQIHLSIKTDKHNIRQQAYHRRFLNL